MAAEKRSDFVAIATGRHGTPAAAMCAGVVVEEKTARGIHAAANGSSGAFDKKFGGGTGDGGEEPLETTLPGHELKRPRTFTKDEFVVSLGDTEEFVDRLSPGRRERLPVHDASEDGPERLAQAKDAEEDGIDGPGFRDKKWAEARGAIFREQARVNEEGDKLVPGQVVGGGGCIGEVEGDTASDEMSGGGGCGGSSACHITSYRF